MTALEQYQRLESTGLWREAADAQRREVTVSFGNATLVISDNAGRALTHWSLPAVTQISTKDNVTVYAPDGDAIETLEINDAEMVGAIEKIRKTLSRRAPRRGRLRLISRLALAVGLVGLSVFWFPDALRNQTLAVVTQTKRTEIGTTILGHLQTMSGHACQSPSGQRALTQLHHRLFGEAAAGRIVVLKDTGGQAHFLPGSIVVIDEAILLRSDDPAVTAGFVIAAHASSDMIDPLGAVMDNAGLREVIRLLTTGNPSNAAMRAFAEHLGPRQPIPVATQELITAFDAADVPATSYAVAIDDAQLAADDPMIGREAAAVLPDNAWVSLQGICDT